MGLILFQDDWDNNPSAIVDYKTKNDSFVEMAALLREMGVKNHNFLLALHNPELQGIDPYDPDLDADTVLAIGAECKENFWYYVREIARDPAGSLEYPLRLQMNRGLLAAYWLFFCSITIYLIMIRQTGKSFGVDWLYMYLASVRCTKTEIGVITLNDKLRSREVERLKGYEQTLPEYLRIRKRFDPANTEIFKFSRLDNVIRFFVPNASQRAADGVGRGMSMPIAGGDEYAYQVNNFITIPVMLTAMNAMRQVALLKDEPTGVILSTTSGKRDTPEGAYAFRKVMEACVFGEYLYDCRNREELYQVVKSGSSDGETVACNCTFNHRQLGKTDEWLRESIKRSEVEDPVQIEADFFNGWPSGTGSDIFTQEKLKEFRASERQPAYGEITNPGLFVIRWYYKQDEIAFKLASVDHVLSIDPSEAIGSDGIGLRLTNIRTGETAAAADISIANIGVFALWLVDFICKYKRITTIIERRSTGAAILDLLLLYLPEREENVFARLYNNVVDDADIRQERFRDIQGNRCMREDVILKYKNEFGWATSGGGKTSRSELYSTTLASAARFCGTILYDSKIINQACGLITKNGRIDHQDGGHDDMVIAWLLGHWFITKAKNLRYYGIEPSMILSDNPERRADENKLNYFERERQIKYRARIDELSNLIKVEESDVLVERYEKEMEWIGGQLIQDNGELISIDALINKLRDERKAFRRNYSGQGYQGYNNSYQNHIEYC